MEVPAADLTTISGICRTLLWLERQSLGSIPATREPERYSCQDAHALQLIADGVDEHLRQKGQWDVYERHVVQLGEVLSKMSENGLPYSAEKAAAFGLELQAKWDSRYAELQATRARVAQAEQAEEWSEEGTQGHDRPRATGVQRSGRAVQPRPCAPLVQAGGVPTHIAIAGTCADPALRPQSGNQSQDQEGHQR